MKAAAYAKLTHLAPVLVVETVEPCVDFWVERFGLKAENAVPGPDGKLIFASVKIDDIEIMYQTRASVAAGEMQSAADCAARPSVLFLTVDDLDAVEEATQGVPVVKARHKTFYGSSELYVREPGGNLIGFAQF